MSIFDVFRALFQCPMHFVEDIIFSVECVERENGRPMTGFSADCVAYRTRSRPVEHVGNRAFVPTWKSLSKRAAYRLA